MDAAHQDYRIRNLTVWDRAVRAWKRRGSRGIGGKWGGYLVSLEDSAVSSRMSTKLPVEVAYGQ